jgi:hypothetical protein
MRKNTIPILERRRFARAQFLYAIFFTTGFVLGSVLFVLLSGPHATDWQVLSKYSNKKLCQGEKKILRCMKVIRLRDRWYKP